jgi:hypothetical protein
MDEKHAPPDQWEIIPSSSQPECVRAIGAVYREGRPIDSANEALIKCVVGEGWIVQRISSGELKIAL